MCVCCVCVVCVVVGEERMVLAPRALEEPAVVELTTVSQ